MPLQRRLPKRGFANIFPQAHRDREHPGSRRASRAGSVVDRAALIKAGLVKGDLDGVKLLAQGDITVPLTIRLQLVSESAKAKIEAAGGKIEVDA